jgi:hypothetical protein
MALYRKDQKLEAGNTHFKVGFLGTNQDVQPMSKSSNPTLRSLNQTYMGTFDLNKQKQSQCNVSFGRNNANMLKTSNQAFFRWIQPKVE